MTPTELFNRITCNGMYEMTEAWFVQALSEWDQSREKTDQDETKGFAREQAIDQIIETVFGQPIETYKQRTRRREIVVGRQVAMMLYSNYTSHSRSHIGRMFGGYDHSTVTHADLHAVPSWLWNKTTYYGRKVALCIDMARNEFDQKPQTKA